MTIDQIIEEVGREADNVDSLIHATNLPMPPWVHVEQLVESLVRLRGRLRSLHIEASGKNPWEGQP